MIFLREPSQAPIRGFLDAQRGLPFPYPEVGASRRGAPNGYPVNRRRGHLGFGGETFSRAVEALRRWRMYDLGWTRLCWPETPIAAGQTVGILGRHFGVWSLNACRIIYVVDEKDAARHRYGFAFGTLPGHMERGEERFTVEWCREDDSVWYELFAFARPAQRKPVGTLAYPLTRLVQRRFAADSYRAMAAAAA